MKQQNKQWHRTRVKSAILRIFPDMHACAETLAKRGRYKTCCGAYGALCQLTSSRSEYFNETLYAHLTKEFLPSFGRKWVFQGERDGSARWDLV